MSGEMLTRIITPVMAVGIALLLGISVNWLWRAVRTIREEFDCPWLHRRVAVRYLTLDGRRPLGVMSCTAFEDLEGVACGMPCLAGKERFFTARARQPGRRSDGDPPPRGSA